MLYTFKNRKYLIELSANNARTMELVESSNLVIVLDDNEPQNYADTSRLAVSGDYHSKWGDRSSTLIAYKNGRFACVGEVRTIYIFLLISKLFIMK